VLIDVAAIAVQGGDLRQREISALTSVPAICGLQAAGTIRQIADGVEGLRIGQPVVATMRGGSHAEIASVHADKVYPIPDGLPLDEAAGVPIEFGTAHECVFEFGRLQPGETVLLQGGTGGVGLAALQLAKAAGAALIMATSSSDARLERLRDFGLDHGINHSRVDTADAVMRHTGGRGVDLVIDSVGGRTLEKSVACVAYRGRIIWVGRAARHDAAPDIWPLQKKNGSVTCVLFGAEDQRAPGRARALVDTLMRRVASGELRSVIDREFPLREAAEAHRYVESRQGFGRVLLRP
jgi:NADPH2:quinone reductase